MQARIFLRDFEVPCFIGIHDFERGVRQRMRFQFALTVARLVPAADRIELVLDYDYLRQQTLALVAERVFDTQEYLLGKLVDIVFSHPDVLAATVETCKPDVYPDSGGVGCSLSLTREEWQQLRQSGQWWQQ
ncbi:MAG: dihydroneopterin aldolase [Vogesella sp.]|uniref:dihydroneopterin aldolase n=1 Tax=Vogesella sp. TaxID=1904252 RepID=UPI00391AAC65